MGSINPSFNFADLTKKLQSQLKIGDNLFFQGENNVYKLTSNSYQQITYNRHNDQHKYSVVKLCEDVFISIEIAFKELKKDKIKTSAGQSIKDWETFITEKEILHHNGRDFEIVISISFFIHNQKLDSYTRVMRAEWDTQMEQNKHPQPHWHFCLSEINQPKYKNFDSFLEEHKDPELFDETKQKNAELEDFHFAMAAIPNKNWNHQHRVTKLQNMSSWVIWLMDHANEQFTYIKKKVSQD